MHGVARVAAEKAVSTRDFAMRMQSEHLYAVYGGYKEKGNRPYWLVWCIKAPYEAPKGLKANDDSTIRKGIWIFDAYFFASTSEDQERRSYKLLSGLDQVVHLLVKSVVQEPDLEFEREGSHDRILGDAAHLSLMRHNYSNVEI